MDAMMAGGSRLEFKQGLMNAAGMLGFAPDAQGKVLWKGFDAFITNPISARRRRAARQAEKLDFPGGTLMHSGLPNHGINASLKAYSGRWAKAEVGIIVNLLGEEAQALRGMVERVEELENVLSIEVSLGGELSPEMVRELCQAAVGELPIIASIAVERALELGPVAVEAGAEVISLGAARGSLPNADGELVSGRLYGPGQLPRALWVTRELATGGLRVVGGGGVYRAEDARAMLAAGALAVQVDTVLWKAGWKAEDWDLSKS